jgi:ADP-ribose pyrophosphatase YjhB (NUDIX family)
LSRLYPTRPIVGVGAIIVHDGKILLEQRKNEPGRGKWSVPGGIVELGETLEHTVIRETEEETGLVVDDPVLIDAVSQISLDDAGKVKYHFVIIDYFVRLKSGTSKAASDAAALEWVSLADVESKGLTPSFRRFFVDNREKLKRMNSDSRSCSSENDVRY